jgi:hypothetical protein
MPPSFLSPKRSIVEVEYGSSVNLTCSANGMPKPKVRWREGVCLQINNNRMNFNQNFLINFFFILPFL